MIDVSALDEVPAGLSAGKAVVRAGAAWKGRTAFRLVLSLLALSQFGLLLIIPNAENIFPDWAHSWVQPYIQAFELTSHWSYFAPDPAGPIFVEWETYGKSGETLEHGVWPDPNAPFFLRERQNRRVETVEFMILDERRVEKIMVPYLCGLKPEVDSVNLWRILRLIPTTDEVLNGTRRPGDDKDQQRVLVSHTFCEGK